MAVSSPSFFIKLLCTLVGVVGIIFLLVAVWLIYEEINPFKLQNPLSPDPGKDFMWWFTLTYLFLLGLLATAVSFSFWRHVQLRKIANRLADKIDE